ncbi:pyridoxamine 5'-phosphate oxidase family protein [Amycolatopsis endophytica]|uniref:Nitroimidazol reductase NimA-like FMN-containing flavoprotein (Pyridoxamine 5'-phosphate oxidase superfamily) n=1 Tax=Amycolatopsis endophytica TaxID=860233 RepID=A0A853B5B7_9PSEU|nr:pyridoxamine 5'-phosphate oxidase family protein [Amycolatopsis endophytica]NYI89766.1 nitroimidazol reductase NimA-like FMN-containing flavoprotein (pyridoxamine 5'-phosphate oxidase superfamily) [Amycolatopsis endophytica]
MFDPFGLEVLGREQCLSLLATAGIGRVVFTARGLPAVQPVRFVLETAAVIFGAPAGSPLFAAADDGVVAFEADAFDEALESGWWVTVLGRARSTGEPARAWPATTSDDRWISIPLDVVSGRRLAR